MKILLLLLAMSAVPIAAQWVPMDTPRGIQLSSLAVGEGGIQYATNRGHLFKRELDEEWSLVDEVYGNYLGGSAAWGDTVVVLAREALGFLYELSRKNAWFSSDRGATWTNYYLGDHTFTLIPNSTRAVGVCECTDSNALIEIYDYVNNIRDTIVWKGDCWHGSAMALASDRDLVLYRMDNSKVNGMYEVTRYYDISKPRSEWQSETFRAPSTPEEVDGGGFTMRYSTGSTSVDNGARIYFYGNEKHQWSSTELAARSDVDLFRDGSRLYAKIGKHLYATENYTDWVSVLIDSVVRELPMQKIKDDRIFSFPKRRQSVYDISTQRLDVVDAGLTAQGEVLVGSNRVVSLGYSNAGFTGIDSWLDTDGFDEIDRRDLPTEGDVVLGRERLWSLHYRARVYHFDTDTLVQFDDNFGIISDNEHGVYFLQRSTVFTWKETDSLPTILFSDSENIVSAQGLTVSENCMVVYCQESDANKRLQTYALKYSRDGTLLHTSLIPYDTAAGGGATKMTQMIGSVHVLMRYGGVHYSTDDGVTWSPLTLPVITHHLPVISPEGIWLCDSARKGVWYTDSPTETWRYFELPSKDLLPNVNLFEAFFLEHNFYVMTSAGMYRHHHDLPIARTGDELSDSCGVKVILGTRVEFSSEGEFVVVDLQGRQVLQTDVYQGYNLDLSYLAQGVYVARMTCESGSQTMKFQIVN